MNNINASKALETLVIPVLLWYNNSMEKIDLTGLLPEQIEYISGLEKQVENQKLRIDQLMEILAKSQKSMYGQSSEKSRYVL